MIDRLLPRHLDNTFPGKKLALGLFALVVLLKVFVGLDAIANGPTMARSGDRIALASLTPAATQTVVSLYALWGFSHLVMCAVCLLALLRYRSSIPLLFVLLLLEHLGRLMILHFRPMAATGPKGDSPGISPVPYGFFFLIALGLVLSLWRPRGDPRSEP